MATILDNQDGTLLLTCTEKEREAFAVLPFGQLAAYVTLWLDERAGSVLKERVAKLPQVDYDDLMSKLEQHDKD